MAVGGENCFVLWAASLRNEILLNYKLTMDQAFINIWGQSETENRLRFDSTPTDKDCAERRVRLSVNQKR